MTRTPDKFVYVVKPACPACGSVELKTTRAVHDQGDGSTLRRVRCRDCAFPFTVILECPEFGLSNSTPK